MKDELKHILAQLREWQPEDKELAQHLLEAEIALRRALARLKSHGGRPS